jgi:PIN like domain/Restriction endonuclease
VSGPDPHRRQDEGGLAGAFRAWWAKEEPAPGPFIRDGVIVLDANVLLFLYRVTPTAREQIFATLSELQNRLWIPHQAALEFHQNRTDVVLSRLNHFREVRQVLKEAANRAVGEVRKAVLRFSKLHQLNMTARTWDPETTGLDEASILRRLDGVMDPALAELTALEAEHDLQPSDVQSVDPVLERLDAITAGRIGRPYNAHRLREFVDEATLYRFPNLIPPGYKDAERKPTAYGAAGDYLLWRQVMDYCATHGRVQMIAMVTNDVKEDWWELDKKGRPKRGRPELKQELFERSGTSMTQLTLSDFLESAAEQFPGRVSPETVSEVRESEAAVQRVEIRDDFFVTVHPVEQRLNLLGLSPYAFEQLIRQLFEAMGYIAIITEDGSPGFDIDAIISDATGPTRTLVVVKRYTKPVPASEVRALYGVMVHERVQNGVVVTTSWFTRAAIEFSERKSITLIDGHRILRPGRLRRPPAHHR